MSFLDRVFRRRTRDATKVDGPTRVRLECRVTSPNDITSPVSQVRAALVRWALLEQRSFHGGRGGGVITRYNVLVRGLYAARPLQLEADGRRLVVDPVTAQLVLIEDPEDGEVLSTLPAALRDQATGLGQGGPLAYREAFLTHGAPVQLTATLDAVSRTRDYRSAAGLDADLVVVGSERLVLREL